MAQGIKFFIFNTEENWKYKNIFQNIRFEDEVLCFDPKLSREGVFISSSFDSGELGNVWHRFIIDTEIPKNSKIKVNFFASDNINLNVFTDTKKTDLVNLDKFILDENIDMNSKINMFLDLNSVCFENPEDVLLFELKGRYLWVCIEAQNFDYESNIKIKSMKIEFPRTSFIDYLPEMYQKTENNSFFSRFMSIFHSMYSDLDDKIDSLPSVFEPMYNDFSFLKWIADWLSIKDAEIWQEKKLRSIINQAVEIFKIKGTPKVLKKMIKISTGEDPIVIEHFKVTDNDFYINHKQEVELLFGDNPYVFTVFLKEKNTILNDEYIRLLKIIEDVTPIETICNLVILQNGIFLSHHCYLEINTFITEKEYTLSNKEINEKSGIVMIG